MFMEPKLRPARGVRKMGLSRDPPSHKLGRSGGNDNKKERRAGF